MGDQTQQKPGPEQGARRSVIEPEELTHFHGIIAADATDTDGHSFKGVEPAVPDAPGPDGHAHARRLTESDEAKDDTEGHR